MSNSNASKEMRFGIIGDSGAHGRRLVKYVEQLGQIIWSCNACDNQSSLATVDWVLISSPNLYHYEYARDFLTAGINVFLEKPPTLSSQSLVELIDLANKNNVHFYIDEVFLFRDDIKLPSKIKSNSQISWKKTDVKAGALLDRLAYHHLYLLKNKFSSAEDLKNINVQVREKTLLKYSFEYCGITIEAIYQSAASVDENKFLDFLIPASAGEAIPRMLKMVFSEQVDFAANQATALWTMRQLELLKRELQPRVAVVGAGLFGCTAALEMAASGYTVDLYERHEDIVQEASAINQYRVHRGYHYPRSDETVNECLSAIPLFMKSYGMAVMKTEVKESFYAIASEKSKVSASEYIGFLERHGLEYEVVENLPNTDLTVRVRENLFDPQKIKNIVKNRLFGSGVTIKCGVEVTQEMLEEYAYCAIATYSSQNKFATKPTLYQFELVEKPILHLPDQYKGRSVVILDGPFMCIDPYSDTPFHVMGNVVHAIHHTNTGYAPEILPGYEKVINRGVIKDAPMSKIKDFLHSAKDFFPGIEHAVHIGSMFTIRTVLPNRDADDARPTIVDWLAPRTVGIFAGKICHSVAAAQSARNLLDEGRL